jgi:Na+/melibiose symporter-like transporter
MELVGPKRRTLCGTAFSAAFAVGVMVVAFWGFIIRDYKILQVVYACHALVLLGHWWLVDESIRWLWGQGRTKEAIDIVEKGVKVNGTHFDRNKVRQRAPLKDDEVQETKGIADLFKKPVIRGRALMVAFVWFANSLVYYGLSLNTGSLMGNPFLMLFFVGLAEVPGYILVILLVDKTGRRSLCAALLIIGGVACLIVSFLQQGLTVTGLVMLGKMAIAGSFAITYNYTAELFPTVVRNSAVGLGACSARFSGMLTPMITLLDTLGTQVPTLIFGSVSILAALLTLFLPETLNKEMPQTMEDGERFGRGDTGYRTCMNCVAGKSEKGHHYNRENNLEVTERLNGVPLTSNGVSPNLA